MTEIRLNWKGLFEMEIETPDWARGKPGIFAITHDSSIVYIGKAQYRNAVFKEAKNCENKWIDCFRINGILPNNVENEVVYGYIAQYCRIYVALIEERLKYLIGS